MFRMFEVFRGFEEFEGVWYYIVLNLINPKVCSVYSVWRVWRGVANYNFTKSIISSEHKFGAVKEFKGVLYSILFNIIT